MKTAEKRRSSRDPSTSQKKRKSEAVARDLEALEKEDVVEEEVPPLHDEIKLEQPEFQEQVVEEMESSETIEKKRMEMEISFKRNENILLTSETAMLKKEKMELKTEITMKRMDNDKLADRVQKLQNHALDLRDKLLKQEKEIMDHKERLKIKDEKVDELAVQLKTQMLKYKTELETLNKQLHSTSTEKNALSKENEMLKDGLRDIVIRFGI